MKQCNRRFETAPVSHRSGLAIGFLYKTVPGRVLLKALIRPKTSKFAGSILNSRATRIYIRGFIKRNNIKIDEYHKVKYRSFNDFFIREIKKELRPFPEREIDVPSPCDGKLSAYPITKDSVFQIKNSLYSVDDLLQDKGLSDEFINGTCLVFRLTPDDYHRYSYIDDGEILHQKRINGKLHTVRPISKNKYRVYAQNAREYILMQTKNFGKVVQMEVGALFVGRITNYANSSTVRRGEEKGMFQFGGSSVIMLFQKDSVKLDDALYENTLRNRETIVRMGNKIGEKRLRNES